jgi:hypothetical protein
MTPRAVKVFLSHSFEPDDRELVARTEMLLNTHDTPVMTGRRLGGGALTPEDVADQR